MNYRIKENSKHNAHNGIIYGIVVRNTWREFRFLIKGLKAFSRKYDKDTWRKVEYPLFKYCVDGFCEHDIEKRELFFWCLNRGII